METSPAVSKKNWALYVALAAPLLMIIMVAAFIYLPGIGKTPQHNFLYMSGSNVYSDVYGYPAAGYQVSSGHLVYTPPPVNQNQNIYPPLATDVHFYVYDVKTNQATEVALAQAETYNLDSSNISADGYSVQQGSGGGDFLFGSSGDYNSWFLKGHNRSTKLNLKLSGGTSYANFRFLGWTE